MNTLSGSVNKGMDIKCWPMSNGDSNGSDDKVELFGEVYQLYALYNLVWERMRPRRSSVQSIKSVLSGA